MERELLAQWRSVYDFLNSTYCEAGSSNPIGDFLETETKVFDFVYDEKENKTGEDETKTSDAIVDTWKFSFALGYAIGTELDVTDPEVIKAISVVKQTIREKHLLPVFPREKKAT